MSRPLNKEERLAAYADLAKTYEHGWEEADKLVRYGAEQERTRIVALINGRMDIHNGFINHCVEHDVRVSDSIFIALSELRSLLRIIEGKK
jgi:hypothetical protein